MLQSTEGVGMQKQVAAVFNNLVYSLSKLPLLMFFKISAAKIHKGIWAEGSWQFFFRSFL